MKLASTLLITLGATGCSAVKYTPALDSELTEAGAALLSSMSVVRLHNADAGYWDPDAEQWINPLFAESRIDSETKISVIENRTTSFVRWGATLGYLFTLGLIPDGFDNTYQLAGTVDRGNDKLDLQLEYSTTVVGGWAACVLWALPGWEFQSSRRERNRSTRAFYTVINQLAEG